MKKLIIGFMMILSLSTGLFAQNIGEKTGNVFLDYMHGRSLFGINFGHTLYAGLFDIGVRFLNIDQMVTSGGGDTSGTDLRSKHYAGYILRGRLHPPFLLSGAAPDNQTLLMPHTPLLRLSGNLLLLPDIFFQKDWMLPVF